MGASVRGQSFFLTFPAWALPFGKTTGSNPEQRVSSRRVCATRMNARSARATNAGAFVAPFVFRFAFIIQSVAGSKREWTVNMSLRFPALDRCGRGRLSRRLSSRQFGDSLFEFVRLRFCERYPFGKVY